MKPIITISNILLADIQEYDCIDETNQKLVPYKTYRRCVLFINHEFYDMQTGELIETLPKSSYGTIVGPIYACTKYIFETYKYNTVTQKDVEYAYELYENILKRKEEIKRLYKEKKLVRFPKRVIY